MQEFSLAVVQRSLTQFRISADGIADADTLSCGVQGAAPVCRVDLRVGTCRRPDVHNIRLKGTAVAMNDSRRLELLVSSTRRADHKSSTRYIDASRSLFLDNESRHGSGGHFLQTSLIVPSPGNAGRVAESKFKLEKAEQISISPAL